MLNTSTWVNILHTRHFKMQIVINDKEWIWGTRIKEKQCNLGSWTNPSSDKNLELKFLKLLFYKMDRAICLFTDLWCVLKKDKE